MAYKIEDFFIALIPSLDQTADISTILCIGEINLFLNKYKIVVASDKFGVVESRNHVVDNLKKQLTAHDIGHGDTIRLLWFDSDMRISDGARELANYIKYADDHHINIIGNYHGLWEGQTRINTLSHKHKRGTWTFYSDDEIKELKPFQRLHATAGGLGFYYGDFPLNYKFRWGSEKREGNWGEDFCFYVDNDLTNSLRYCPVRLLHKKSVWI